MMEKLSQRPRLPFTDGRDSHAKLEQGQECGQALFPQFGPGSSQSEWQYGFGWMANPRSRHPRCGPEGGTDG
jgi:hypothetical protein